MGGNVSEIMRQFRKVIFWAHLFAGVLAGVVILMMCITGLLLAFEESITIWADGYHSEAASYGGPKASLNSIIANATGTTPPLSMITLRAEKDLPIALAFGREKTLFFDPYSGQNLGEGAKRTRAVFRTINDWHRWLGRPESSRALGKAITGACNLAFLFLVLSGFYLWWPRSLTWSSLRSSLLLNFQARGKARDWNWHNVLGFWSAAPLFVIVLSGVIISYPWANSLLYRLTGNEPPRARAEKPSAERTAKNSRADENPGSPTTRHAASTLRWPRSKQNFPAGKQFESACLPKATVHSPS